MQNSHLNMWRRFDIIAVWIRRFWCTRSSSRLFIYPSIYQSIYIYLHLSTPNSYLYIYLYVCLSICIARLLCYNPMKLYFRITRSYMLIYMYNKSPVWQPFHQRNIIPILSLTYWYLKKKTQLNNKYNEYDYMLYQVLGKGESAEIKMFSVSLLFRGSVRLLPYYTIIIYTHAIHSYMHTCINSRRTETHQ